MDAIEKLARMLRTPPEVLRELERKMHALTGQAGVLDAIVKENDSLVARAMTTLHLTHSAEPAAVRAGLLDLLGKLDARLYTMLGEPNLSRAQDAQMKLRKMIDKLFPLPRGLFLKRERVAQMLEQHPPQTLLDHFGYVTTAELLEKEGFAPVMAALRFTQTQEWMHQFFEEAYHELSPDDFEERDVEFLVLDDRWRLVAEKFIAKKYHNVSHLKELGIIFVIPIPLNMAGETMRLFTLILHYLHEVPFYSNLFRHFMREEDFSAKFRSLLRGDVPSGPAPITSADGVTWRVVQRYLAKDDEHDPRLFEPHVNPEADHWWHAEQDLMRLSRVLDGGGELDPGWWTDLDFVGELFDGEVVSFDLIDLLMSLVKGEKGKYLYHQQEALWNKIFIAYRGRDQMEGLIDEHIIDGFITL